MANAQHSAETHNHGSPPVAVELGRYSLGHFDFDPASAPYWNHYVIKAKTICVDDGRLGGLDPRVRWHGNVWHNPPGSTPKTETVPEFMKRSKPRLFWERLINEYFLGNIDAACFYGFSLEQLQQFQGSPKHPLQFLTNFPASRLDCLIQAPGNGPPIPNTQPTHAAFITLLPSNKSRDLAKEQIARFIEGSSRLDMCPGAVVRPV